MTIKENNQEYEHSNMHTNMNLEDSLNSGVNSAHRPGFAHQSVSRIVSRTLECGLDNMNSGDSSNLRSNSALETHFNSVSGSMASPSSAHQNVPRKLPSGSNNNNANDGRKSSTSSAVKFVTDSFFSSSTSIESLKTQMSIEYENAMKAARHLPWEITLHGHKYSIRKYADMYDAKLPRFRKLFLRERIRTLFMACKDPDASTYAFAIQIFMKIGDHKNVNQCLDRWIDNAKDAPLSPYLALLLFACTKNDDIYTPFRRKALTEELDKRSLNVDHESLIRLRGTQGEKCFENVYLSLMQQEDTGLTESQYNQLCKYFLARKGFNEASLVIKDMVNRRVKPNRHIVTTLLRQFGLLKDSDMSWHAYRYMEKTRLKPDVVSMTCVILLCCASSNFDMAFQYFDRMPEAGIVPNAYAYSAIMTAAAKACDFSRLCQYWSNMLADGLKPTIELYTVLIMGCWIANRFQDGWTAYKTIYQNNMKPDEFVFHYTLRLCQKARKTREYDLVLLHVQESGFDLNDINKRNKRKQKMTLRIFDFTMNI